MMRVNSENEAVLVVIPRGVDGQTVQSSMNAENTLQSNYEGFQDAVPNEKGDSRPVVVPLKIQMADTASVSNKPLTPVQDSDNGGKRNSLIIICSNENEDPLDPEGNNRMKPTQFGGQTVDSSQVKSLREENSNIVTTPTNNSHVAAPDKEYMSPTQSSQIRRSVKKDR